MAPALDRGTAVSWRELTHRVRARALERPDAIAFDGGVGDEDGAVSWRTLTERIAAIERRVDDLGLAGSTVVVCALSPGWTAAFVTGLLARGAGVCLVDGAHGRVGVQQAATAVDACAVIMPRDRCASHRDALGPERFLDRTADDASMHARRRPGAGGGHVMLRTSGTLSGRPRFVRRTADSVAFVARAVSEHLEFEEGDRVIGIASQSHSYGFEHALLAPLWSGATTILTGGLRLDRIDRALADGATHLPGVPALYDLLADRPELRAPRLRLAYSAGAILPISVAERFERAQRRRIGQLYGATEFGSITFCDPRDPHFEPACSGRPFDGITVDAEPIPHEGSSQEPARCELVIQGPSTFVGYVGDHAAPRRVRSGDFGRIDGHGRVWVDGRLHGLIDVGGAKVNPAEVESALLAHPSVRECVVVPIGQASCVQRIRAVVVPADGAVDVDALRRFARERLPAHMVPRVVEVWDELPRSSTGKILVHKVIES